MVKYGHCIQWSISHVQQSGNKAVDKLARIGVTGTNFIEFVRGLSPFEPFVVSISIFSG